MIKIQDNISNTIIGIKSDVTGFIRSNNSLVLLVNMPFIHI